MNTRKARLEKTGIRQIISVNLAFALQMLVLFIAAGRTDLFHIWAYIAILYTYQILSIIYFVKKSPQMIEMFNERGKRHEGTKKWDKLFMAVYTPFVFIIPAVTGLDLGRYEWSVISTYFFIPGIIILLSAYMLSHWAMNSNKHFERTVRIQEERDHQVITGGPYKFVRHPGYSGIIIMNLAFPLVACSLITFIPALIASFLFVIRTALEDKTLRSELKGYPEYAAKVRFRLAPGLW